VVNPPNTKGAPPSAFEGESSIEPRAANPSSPSGLTAMGLFLCFAATMASLASFLLLKPGTFLDRAWALNPRAHAQFASLGPLIPWVGFGFFLLAILAACTARLWFQRRLIAWRIAVVGIAMQAVGDAVNFLRGEHLPGMVGFLIASLLIAFLLSPRVKSAFH
jgi:hypothetical protein